MKEMITAQISDVIWGILCFNGYVNYEKTSLIVWDIYSISIFPQCQQRQLHKTETIQRKSMSAGTAKKPTLEDSLIFNIKGNKNKTIVATNQRVMNTRSYLGNSNLPDKTVESFFSVNEPLNLILPVK